MPNLRLGFDKQGKQNKLQLCDKYSGNGALRCDLSTSGCPGAANNYCYPYNVWSETPNGSNYYSPNLNNGTFNPTNNNPPTFAFSVRCVLGFELRISPIRK